MPLRECIWVLCIRLTSAHTATPLGKHPLANGQRLTTLPIWLKETRAISLELESSYEETCRTLRIR